MRKNLKGIQMGKVFFGGMPTGPDVRKLIQTFGNPTVGAEITHEQVQTVLGFDSHSSRYKSVVSAWRKQLLKDQNIDLDAVSGFGFRAMNPSERISKGLAGVQVGVRKQLRSVKRADRVNTDDPILQRKQDVMRRSAMAIMNEWNNATKQIEPPRAPDQLPKVVPLKAQGQ